MDLDYVLGVISDGPTKSFAYKRLKYLASKFDMYTLLNELQEVAEMKVHNIVCVAAICLYLNRTARSPSVCRIQA